jgi:hypothetical protein
MGGMQRRVAVEDPGGEDGLEDSEARQGAVRHAA